MNYITKTEENFFRFWKMEINIEDNRSLTMPSKSKGLVIGIKEGSVLIRVGNNITDWYPLNNKTVNFYID